MSYNELQCSRLKQTMVNTAKLNKTQYAYFTSKHYAVLWLCRAEHRYIFIDDEKSMQIYAAT